MGKRNEANSELVVLQCTLITSGVVCYKEEAARLVAGGASHNQHLAWAEPLIPAEGGFVTHGCESRTG